MRLLCNQSWKGISKDRINRALKSKSRIAGESLKLNLGDLVDFYRTPQNKDASGWIGPATVVNLTDLASGRVDVKWQGYIYSCQVRDIRPALVFYTYVMERGHSAASAALPLWQAIQARIHNSKSQQIHIAAAHWYQQGVRLTKLAERESPTFTLTSCVLLTAILAL